MSLPTLHGTGQILADVKTGNTKSGGTWTSALVKFSTWKKTDAGWEEGEPTIASCVAFKDEPAAALAGFAKGDKIELYGSANVEMWNDKPRFKVVVEKCRVPVKKPAGDGAPRQREPQPA